MNLTFHHLFATLTASALVGGALALTAHTTSTPSQAADLSERFTAGDKAIFSEGFRIADGTCEVGFAERDICFEGSHLEDRVVKGEPFPQDMYPLALEWRIELAMSRKADDLKTVRIGRTIALVERGSEIVVDTIHLGAQPETQMARTGRAG